MLAELCQETGDTGLFFAFPPDLRPTLDTLSTQMVEGFALSKFASVSMSFENCSGFFFPGEIL